MRFTAAMAKEIIEAHEIAPLMDGGEETELLQENNPSLFNAYQALIDFSKGRK